VGFEVKVIGEKVLYWLARNLRYGVGGIEPLRAAYDLSIPDDSSGADQRF
jgi:hypothetical protein